MAAVAEDSFDFSFVESGAGTGEAMPFALLPEGDAFEAGDEASAGGEDLLGDGEWDTDTVCDEAWKGRAMSVPAVDMCVTP